MSRNRFGRLLAELSTSAASRIHNCFISRRGSKTNHIVRSMAEHSGIVNGLALPSIALLCFIIICCYFPLKQHCKGNPPTVLCDFVSTIGISPHHIVFPLELCASFFSPASASQCRVRESTMRSASLAMMQTWKIFPSDLAFTCFFEMITKNDRMVAW